MRDAEIERLRAEVHCATVIEKLSPGWKLDAAESTRHCLKYRRRPGEILIINHAGRGWWDPTGDAKGDVFALVQHLDPSLNFGQARRLLREFTGLAPEYAPAERRSDSPTSGRSIPELWQTRRRLCRGSGTWGYLTEQRALPGGILAVAARQDSVREGPFGSAWFVHRDHDGRLTGIDMRGPNFRGFSSKGRKCLFQLRGAAGQPHRLVVLEAPIDALSLAAIEWLRRDSLYLATSGGMGPDTVAALQAFLTEVGGRPEALLVCATDNDAAGERYAAKLGELAQKVGLPFDRALPPDGLKDWNDVLKAIRHK